MKSYRKFLSAALAIAMLLACCACGQTPASPAADGAISVNSADALLEAIYPNTEIIIEPGYYNLTDALNAAWEQGDEWAEAHPYLELEECFDGLGLVICNVENLTITGGEDKISEIVIDPRYAAVLTLSGCADIELKNLTLGHTEKGNCSGAVLAVRDCGNISIEGMDLYGCGVVGTELENVSGFTAKDCRIHDCSDAAATIMGCSSVRYENCEFCDNGWGISCWENIDFPVFEKCSFGQEESNSAVFSEEIQLIDCDVMEPTYYPDVDPGIDFEYYNLEGWEIIPFDKEVLDNSYWAGYCFKTFEGSEYFELNDPEIPFLIFDENGSTAIYELGVEDIDFRWYVDDSGYTAAITEWESEDEEYDWADLSLFADPYEEESDIVMLITTINGESIYCLRIM